ncbi:MAG: hypothetical protein M3265_08215 [Actinomycetota bacterium]|nr:hypothetical protein [Actinomycetota bacterium]
MTAIVVILVLTGIVTGILFVAGLGLFALILIPIGIAVAVWLGLTSARGKTATDVARRESDQEFLGPGGPDDPTA